MVRCQACHVEGFAWNTTNSHTVDTAVNIDGYTGGNISTLNVVRYNCFNFSNQLNTDAKLVSISATVTNNNENMEVSKNLFNVSSASNSSSAGIAIYNGASPNA